MITATDLEVRAGARTLLSTDGQALRVQPDDRIGLVGRNGAGKTTTMRILAGEAEPYAGAIARSGEMVALPRIPRRATSISRPATGCCPRAAWIRCSPIWRNSRP